MWRLSQQPRGVEEVIGNVIKWPGTISMYHTNVSFLVLTLCYSYLGCDHRGNWVKGTQDLSKPSLQFPLNPQLFQSSKFLQNGDDRDGKRVESAGLSD